MSQTALLVALNYRGIFTTHWFQQYERSVHTYLQVRMWDEEMLKLLSCFRVLWVKPYSFAESFSGLYLLNDSVKSWLYWCPAQHCLWLTHPHCPLFTKRVQGGNRIEKRGPIISASTWWNRSNHPCRLSVLRRLCHFWRTDMADGLKD